MPRHMPWAWKHGDAQNVKQASEYNAWRSMRRRCHTPTDAAFKNYGARGISVCPRWRESYKNFLEDMGRKPSADHTLERIDNNGNYEPSNCRWATRLEQGQNRRSTKHQIEYFGETRTIRGWSEATGIPWYIIYRRIVTDGWEVERALRTAVGKRRGEGFTTLSPRGPGGFPH